MSKIIDDTITGVKWTTVERFFQQGIQFIIGIVLARLLTPADFGVIGMLTIFITISQTFIDGGFTNALIRKLKCDESDYTTAFYFNVVVGFVCYFILYVISPYVALFFKTPALCELLKILAFTVLVNSFSIVQIARLTRFLDFKTQAIATIVAVLLSGSIGIYLANAGYGPWALVGQTVSAAIIKCTILWIYTKWIPKFTFSVESFVDMFNFGSKLLTSNLINSIYAHLTTIIIGRFYSSKDLGVYSRGQQFAHLPSMTITDVLGKVTFPILSKLQDDDSRLVAVYRRYIRITSMVIFFFMCLLIAISKPLILIILTDKWINSVIYLQLFSFAYMFEHISKLNLNLLQVKGRSDLYLKLELIKKTIAISLMLLSVKFGVVYICLSIVVYSQIALFINTYYTGKLFKLGYFMQINDFSKYLLCSILSCLPAYGLNFCSFSEWIKFVLGMTISMLLYYLLVRKDEHFVEIRNLFFQQIKRTRK